MTMDIISDPETTASSRPMNQSSDAKSISGNDRGMKSIIYMFQPFCERHRCGHETQIPFRVI